MIRTPVDHEPGRRPRILAAALDQREDGGPEGNSRLTALTGTLLVLLLAVLGWTILSITRRVTVHVFVGILLTAPVLLKLASTGYRFLRYHTGAPAYLRQGPPPPVRRLLAAELGGRSGRRGPLAPGRGRRWSVLALALAAGAALASAGVHLASAWRR